LLELARPRLKVPFGAVDAGASLTSKVIAICCYPQAFDRGHMGQSGQVKVQFLLYDIRSASAYNNS
jgi:hypothetical protein